MFLYEEIVIPILIAILVVIIVAFWYHNKKTPIVPVLPPKSKEDPVHKSVVDHIKKQVKKEDDNKKAHPSVTPPKKAIDPKTNKVVVQHPNKEIFLVLVGGDEKPNYIEAEKLANAFESKIAPLAQFDEAVKSGAQWYHYSAVINSERNGLHDEIMVPLKKVTYYHESIKDTGAVYGICLYGPKPTQPKMSLISDNTCHSGNCVVPWYAPHLKGDSKTVIWSRFD